MMIYYDSPWKQILTDEDFREAKVEYVLLSLSHQLRDALDASELGVQEIAASMGLKSTRQVEKLVNWNEQANPTIRVLVRFAHACGYDLEVALRRRSRS